MSSPSAAVRRKNNEPFVARMIDEAANRVPPKYAEYVRATKPVIVGISAGIDAAWPYVALAWSYVVIGWEKLQPYNPQQFFPLLAGLAMCFFGGSYLTLIAAVEAVRLSVWDRLSKALHTLYKNYCVAHEVNEKDNLRDDNNDGIADVDQITNSELFTRKVYIFAKAIDPEQTSDAMSALWAGFLSVLATVRIKFAQFITLGCAMGDMARDNLGPKLEPLVNDALPQELKKWAPTIVRQIFATLGVMLALFLQRIVGGLHAAVRGSQIAMTNGIALAKKHGFLSQSFDEHSKEANAAAMVLAAFGFFWQLSNGFAVGFPLSILFFPATVLEWLLSVSLTVGL